MATKSLVYVITGKDELSPVMRRAARNADRAFSGVAVGITAGIVGGLASLPVAVAGAAALGGIALGAGLIKAAASTMQKQQKTLLIQVNQLQAKIKKGTATSADKSLLSADKQQLAFLQQQLVLYNSVTTAAKNLKNTALQVFGQAITPLLKPFQLALTNIGAFLTRNKGLFKEFFASVAPYVPMVTGFFESLVTGLLPPTINLLNRAHGPVSQMLKAFAGLVNTGIGQLFASLAGSLAPSAVAFGHILTAVAPLLPLLGGMAGLAARLIATLPPSVIQAIAVAFVTLTIATKAFGLAMLLLDANPFVLLASAIAVGAVLIATHWRGALTVLKTVWIAIQAGFADMGIAVLTGLKFIVSGFLSFVGTIIHGAADAFGWIPGIGGKVKAASAAFDSFKQGVDKSFDGIIGKMQAFRNNLTDNNGSVASSTAIITADFARQGASAHAAAGNIDRLSTAINQNGASSTQAKAARQTLINNLISAGVNSHTATADVDRYTQAVSLNGAKSDAAKAARDRLNADIRLASDRAARSRQDVGLLTAAIVSHGQNSDAVRAARTRLINDLRQSGTDAATAKKKVDDLITSISHLPHNTQIAIKEVVSGGGKIVIQGDVATNQSTGIGVSLKTGEKTFNGYSYATGGRVGGRGTATSDSNMIAASRGEWVINAGASGMYGNAAMSAVNSGTAVIGYAKGGPVAMTNQLIPSTAHLSEQVMGSASADFVKGAKSYLAKIAQEMLAFGSAPPGGATGSEMQNGIAIYKYLLANVFGGVARAAAGATASIWGESTWNPFAQGTGGRGLIGWTPPGTISDAAFAGGLRTQLPAIVRFISTSGDWGVIAQMKAAGLAGASITALAEMWGRGVERYGIDDVHATGVALATSIMNQVSAGASGTVNGVYTHKGATSFNGYAYDRGGILPPGFTMAYNGTGRNEYVSRGGGNVYNITVNPTPLARPRDIGREVVEAIKAYESGNGKGWRS